jgi:Ni/Co efflux regulator RcnB
MSMRKIVALLAGVAAMAVSATASVSTSENEAQAHAPCQGGSHWHKHAAHRDYWHDHGTFKRGGQVYRKYHIHPHGYYRAKRCR